MDPAECLLQYERPFQSSEDEAQGRRIRPPTSRLAEIAEAAVPDDGFRSLSAILIVVR